MKKTLLIGLAFGMCISVNAQNKAKFTQIVKRAPKMDMHHFAAFKNDPNVVHNEQFPGAKQSTNPTVASIQAVNKIPMGGSYNLFSVLDADCRGITYNGDVNEIMFSHRQNSEYAGNSGYVQVSYSTDGGATFDTSLVMTNSATFLGRYPSGVIYNPTGNTSPMNAYAVVTGPATGGSGWLGNYFASIKMDSTNDNQQNKNIDSAGVVFQHFARTNSQECDNGKMYVLGSDYDANSTATTIPLNGVVINTGTFNSTSNSVDWTQKHLYFAFAHDNTGAQQFTTLGNMAWSQDGMTGYAFVYGEDSTTMYNTIQPIVYKTTDGGTTWTEMTPFDFSTITAITNKLLPTNSGTYVPYFSWDAGIGTSVDANGNLHIATGIYSASTTSPDSVGYIYPNLELAFDVHTTSSGWDAVFIDTLRTKYVPNASSPWTYGGGLGWGSRMQISRTKDGTKLFYTWMQTNPNLVTDTLNSFPDLYGMGYDVTNGNTTAVTNFTAGTAYDGANYWKFASDMVISNSGTYTIPMSTTQSRTAGDDGTGPVQHYYVSGIQFSDADFLSGINENKALTLGVTQNYPNPFTKTTAFTINLNKTSDVNIAVYNTLGQKVWENTTPKMTAGQHTMHINAAKFSAGLYFYTVKAAGHSVTHKMIVE